LIMADKPKGGFRLIASQGRIGDRTSNAIKGAKATAELLTGMLGLQPQIIGSPSDAQIDDWRDSLPAARDVLVELNAAVAEAFALGETPIVAVNTCSASLATLPAAVQAVDGLKVLWVDAHGDFNTPETTGSGYLGGMVLGAVCGGWESGLGAGLSPDRVLIAGIRDVDEDEDALLREAGVKQLPPDQVTSEAVLSFVGDSPLWIHIDWDVMDPGQVPAAYSIDKGLFADQLRAVFLALPTAQIVGIELAEFEQPESEQQRARAVATIESLFAHQALT
jgi:arginase